MTKGAALLAALAAGVSCDGGTRPTADCMNWPESRVLATSPASGTTLATGQTVEVSARFEFTACRTISGMLTVPEQGVTAVSVGFVMILGSRSGPRELLRLDYPVR